MSGKLGDILISHGVIDSEKLIAALSDQRAFGGKLGRTLVDLGYVTEEELVRALSEQLGLDAVDLDETEVQADALRCLPVDACERYGVFPVKVDEAERVLWVATAEPDRQTLQEVARICGYTLEPVLAPMSSIDRAVRKSYFGERIARRPRLGEPLRSIPGDIPWAAPPPRSVPNRSRDAAFPDPLPEPEVAGIGPIAPEGSAPDVVEELKTLIIRLEKTVSAQSRAFRALVDLLQEKGIVRRGELGQRAARK
jgi:type IV pilus assembly protein PilB